MKHKPEKKKKNIITENYSIILLLGIILVFGGLIVMLNETTVNPPPPPLPYTEISIDDGIPPGSLLIDIRTSDLYNTSHIGGSINIPFNTSLSGKLYFSTTIKTFDYNNRSKPHVLYGYDTAEAAEIMAGIGFTDLYVLTDWWRWIP